MEAIQHFDSTEHTELCDVLSGGPCVCKPISVQLAGSGSWAPSNCIAIPKPHSKRQRVREVNDKAIRVSIRRYSRVGEVL